MKKILMLLLCCLLSFSLFGQIKSMDEYRAKKIEFYCEEDFNKVVNMVQAELDYLHDHKDEYSEELYLSIENVLYVDQLFFSLIDNELPKDKKEYFKEIFFDQEKKSEDFMGENDFSKMSSDFLLSVGDVKCQMTYVTSIPKAIPKLTRAKAFYDNAVINNPENCAALISQALWYFYSPGISGGSKKKAYKIIQQAEEAVKIPSDRFFVLAFKGQIEDGLKKDDECQASLKAAHDLYPNETFTGLLAKNLEIELDF